MKNNKIKAYIIHVIICLALLTQSNGYAQNAVSEAEVQFTPGTGPTYPVYPEDPNAEGNEAGVSGSLAIVSVSHFDFGTIPVATTTQKLDITTIMPNIQVVDLRGTATGWKVSAEVSRFTDGETETLPGAAIHIVEGRPNSLSSSPAPKQEADALLPTDGKPVLVLTAKNGEGTGLWVMRWYPLEDEDKYITLEIPAGSATIGSHTATINWILEDTL